MNSLTPNAASPESCRAGAASLLSAQAQRSLPVGATAASEGGGGSGCGSASHFSTVLKDASRNARSLDAQSALNPQPRGSQVTRHSLLVHTQIFVYVHTHTQPTHVHTWFLHRLWTARAAVCAHHASASPSISKALYVHGGTESHRQKEETRLAESLLSSPKTRSRCPSSCSLSLGSLSCRDREGALPWVRGAPPCWPS